ncbi:MAG: LPXTG cell wall anchor domain-containing protein [Candidatus Cohnella colombiensis]|uniref:LPXTG cell wall anchor domain-containing protein n=1 Tax=Candidatus Cohnella colombiensis TaxID=3121368 RepID=A0AA95F407_9BACL|nr:MAG: LPXTG cell wall anchor domain-containing protein [Cohnella sp.]
MKTVVKSRKFTASLLLALALMLVMSLTAMAADDDLVYDNYDRATLSDFASSGANAAWTGGDAGKSASIDSNALKLEFGSSGWFGTGGGIDASQYKYIVIRAKGAAGGEGSAFDLNYAVGDQVKTIGKAFADLVGPSGDKVPAITKDYQNIVIDMKGNGIESGIQAFHFNFHDGASGTLWIDSISFTNNAPKEPAKDNGAATKTDEGAAAPVAEPNPKTGDTMNTSLYIALAAVSGAAALFLVFKARKANR